MSINGLPLTDVNTRFNTIAGVKKYQQVKKVMEEFDNKLKQEVAKTDKFKINIQIK